jgi:hypothetical protein
VKAAILGINEMSTSIGHVENLAITHCIVV